MKSKAMKLKSKTVNTVGLALMMTSVLTFLSDTYSFIGVPMYLLSVAISVACILLAFRQQGNNIMLLWYIIFWGCMLISLLYSSHPAEGLSTIIYGRYQVLIILFCFAYCKSEDDVQKAMQCYVFACVALSLIILKDGSLSFRNVRYGWSTTGGQPNTPALNIGAGIAFCLYFFRKGKTILHKALNVSLIILFCVTIFLTGSRKMIIYIAGIFLLDAFYVSKNIKKTVTRVLLLGILIIGGYIILSHNAVLYNTIGARMFSLNIDESAGERSLLRQGAIDCFLGSPIVGNDIDTYKYTSIFGVYAHNNYVELLAGIGAVGMVVYYSLFIYMTIHMWKNRENKLNFLFACIMMMTFVIEWYNVNYLQRGIWFIYSLAYCEYRLTNQKPFRGGVQDLANNIDIFCYSPQYVYFNFSFVSYWRLSNYIKLFYGYGARQFRREAAV